MPFGDHRLYACRLFQYHNVVLELHHFRLDPVFAPCVVDKVFDLCCLFLNWKRSSTGCCMRGHFWRKQNRFVLPIRLVARSSFSSLVRCFSNMSNFLLVCRLSAASCLDGLAGWLSHLRLLGPGFFSTSLDNNSSQAVKSTYMNTNWMVYIVS